MPTYVYETVAAGKKAKRYEIRHGINEPALSRHPETGEPIRRVVSTGGGIISKGGSRAPAPRAPQSGGHCCGASCGCH